VLRLGHGLGGYPRLFVGAPDDLVVYVAEAAISSPPEPSELATVMTRDVIGLPSLRWGRVAKLAANALHKVD